MYLALKAGKTSLFQRAQCGQPTEAYSITVTLAVGGPMPMSASVAPPPPPGLQATSVAARPRVIIRAARTRIGRLRVRLFNRARFRGRDEEGGCVAKRVSAHPH